jgi:hypothetical protein
MLYLETLFALLYVEQKTGWDRLPAKYPTWLGIRHVGRRTVEFLLGLDAYANALELVAVQEEIKRLDANGPPHDRRRRSLPPPSWEHWRHPGATYFFPATGNRTDAFGDAVAEMDADHRVPPCSACTID